MNKIIEIIFIVSFCLLYTNFDANSSTTRYPNIFRANDQWCEYYFNEYKLNQYKDTVTNQNLTLSKFKNLTLAIGKWESNLDHKKLTYEPVTNGYAYGTYGLLSPTAKWMGWNGKNPKELLIPENNAKYAIKFFAKQIEKNNGNIIYSLASYNAGSLRFDDNGNIKNNNYVINVYPLYVSLNQK